MGSPGLPPSQAPKPEASRHRRREKGSTAPPPYKYAHANASTWPGGAPINYLLRNCRVQPPAACCSAALVAVAVDPALRQLLAKVLLVALLHFLLRAPPHRGCQSLAPDSCDLKTDARRAKWAPLPFRAGVKAHGRHRMLARATEHSARTDSSNPDLKAKVEARAMAVTTKAPPTIAPIGASTSPYSASWKTTLERSARCVAGRRLSCVAGRRLRHIQEAAASAPQQPGHGYGSLQPPASPASRPVTAEQGVSAGGEAGKEELQQHAPFRGRSSLTQGRRWRPVQSFCCSREKVCLRQ